MTEKLHTVSPDTSYQDIKEIFDQQDFHHLLVTSAGGELAGIISQKDLLENRQELSVETSGRVWTQKYTSALQAHHIMTPFPIVLDPDDSIGLAADIFLANRFHALPIVENGDLMGIVTTHDLLRYAFSREFA